MQTGETPLAIPNELARHATEFTFPGGARIRRMTARDEDREGWAIDLGAHRFMYEDGTAGELPRYRAFAELGFNAGEDDMHTDADWEAFSEAKRRWSQQLLMPLARAWEVAQENGVANREPKEGENVIERSSDRKAVVTQVFHGISDDVSGVKIRYEDGSEGSCELRALVLCNDKVYW